MFHDGVVVDADVISHFIHEEMGNPNELSLIINDILDTIGIAITDRIEGDWRSTTGNQFFGIWFEDNVKEKKIKYICEDRRLEKGEKTVIHVKLGLPKDNSRDIALIQCALNTQIKYITTLDLHLFDPEIGKYTSKKRDEIKNSGKGKLSRHLKKEFDITVGLPKKCHSDLCQCGIIQESHEELLIDS
jgi:hypothetical protein